MRSVQSCSAVTLRIAIFVTLCLTGVNSQAATEEEMLERAQKILSAQIKRMARENEEADDAASVTNQLVSD